MALKNKQTEVGKWHQISGEPVSIYKNESKLIVWVLQRLLIFCQHLTKYGCRPIFTNLA